VSGVGARPKAPSVVELPRSSVSSVACVGQLNREARTYFLSALVAQGRAAWLDKDKVRCLIYWKTPAEWASTIAAWARDCALIDSVVTLEELSSGEDVAGTDLEGAPCDILLPALKLLESSGQARLFKGTTPGEEGVKFLR